MNKGYQSMDEVVGALRVACALEQPARHNAVKVVANAAHGMLGSDLPRTVVVSEIITQADPRLTQSETLAVLRYLVQRA